MLENKASTLQLDPTAEAHAEESALSQTDQILQQMEQSSLGFSDTDQTHDLARDIDRYSYNIAQSTEGVLKYKGSAVESAEDFSNLGRLLKSSVMYGYNGDNIRKALEAMKDGRLIGAFDQAEPYNVNYFALHAIRSMSLPAIPGTRDYAEMFETAGQEHITPPAVWLSSEDVQGKDSKGNLKTVANVYFQQMAKAELESSTDRLIALRQNDVLKDTEVEPSCTICVPIAAFGETEATIKQTLDTISNQTIAAQTEVILYMNYKNDERATHDALQEKHDMLKRLQLDAQSKQPDAPKVRFVIEGYEPDDLSISRIRKDYMDMLALDLQDRGVGYDHTVLWLDADTTRLSDNVVEEHVKAHQGNPYDLRFASSSVRFTMSDQEPVGTEVSQAQRLASYAEIQRRRNVRQNRGQHYIEESGLSFSIGSYLFTGGVNAADQLNEATWLDVNAQSYDFANRRVFGDQVTYSTHAITSARVYTSGRRQVGNAEAKLESGSEYLTSSLYFTHDIGDFVGSDDTLRSGNAEYGSDHSKELVTRTANNIDHLSAARDQSDEEYLANKANNQRARKLIGIH